MSTKNYSKELQTLTRNYFLISFCITLVNSLPGVILSLFLIDQFDYAFAGILFSIMAFSQFIFDYPTGALSDYIGQKRVEILAILIYSPSILLLGIANSKISFIIIMILLGLGNALFSGVVQTWFSNNYDYLIPQDLDEDRNIYGSIMARIRSYTFLTVAFSVFIGATISTIFSRNFVFILNGILGFFLIIVIIVLLNDFYDQEKQEKASLQTHVKNYLKITFKSINIVSTDYLLLSTIIGILLITASLGPVFIQLIYFPVVFGYTGTDSFIGISQFVIYLVLAINIFLIGIYARKFNRQYMVVFFIFYVLFFTNSLLILLHVISPTMSLNLPALVFIVLIYLFFDSFIGEIAVNLQQRIFLDLIPSAFRNSILSLYSSLMAVIVAIYYFTVGLVIQKYDLDGGIVFMEITGIAGCIFLLPTLFSHRLKNSNKTKIVK